MSENSPDRTVTRADVLAAIVAGDRTVQQLTDRLGATGLSGLLDAMVCDDLLCMEVVDRTWHYKPTRRGRQAALCTRCRVMPADPGEAWCPDCTENDDRGVYVAGVRVDPADLDD